MSFYLPSSDDESAEMEAMRTKVKLLQQGRKRIRLSNSEADDDEEEEEEEDSSDPNNRLHSPQSKKKKTANDDNDKSVMSPSSFWSVSTSSLESIDEESVDSAIPPKTTTVHCYVEGPPCDDLGQALKFLQESNDSSSTTAKTSSSNMSQPGGKDNDDGAAVLAPRQGTSDKQSVEFDHDLDCLDDAALEAAFAQAEAEHFSLMHASHRSVVSPHNQVSKSSRSSSRRDMSHDNKPLPKAPPKQATVDNSIATAVTTPSKEQPTDKTFPRQLQNQVRKQSSARQIRQATEEEEDWIEAYLQQQDQQVESSFCHQGDPVISSHGDLEPRRATDRSRTVSGYFGSSKYDGFNSTNASQINLEKETSSPNGVENADDDWVQELLREQEKQAQGQVATSSPLQETNLCFVGSPPGFDKEQISQAFGFSPTNKSPSQTRDLGFDSPSEEEIDEIGPLEIPSREDQESRQADDGIERDERYPEVDPSRYPLPSHRSRPEPLVHFFTSQSHPPQSRRRHPVVSIFTKPQVSKFFRIKFENFNTMQSELSNMLAHSDDHLVVAAPTGAGKTAIFEMAMARFFTNDTQSISGNHHIGGSKDAPHILSTQRKIVYISPSKALCEERFEDWTQRLEGTKLGVKVAAVTGDGDPGESFRDVASAQLILTTPEKWDSLTRRWTENFFLLASVKLVLVDEIHLLADPTRGPCLEAVINRIKSIQHVAEHHIATQDDVVSSSFVNTTPEALASPMRIVAVSATLPNISEIAEFLTANEAFVFDESYRPVPLKTHVLGLGNSGTNSFMFWKSLDREVPPIIHRFSEGRPAIVFCHSKADTERLADMLAKCPGIGQEGKNDIASKTRLAKLQRVLYSGIAYHHAGMELDDRRLVEQSFAASKIRVLCTTSTLAMGINLPARLVVIKGTKAYRGHSNGYQDLDHASLLQMIGRAGRPGYDTSGTAVIMTESRSKPMFERMATSGLQPAQSQLMSTFEEILNAEISQKVITDMSSALNWIKGTLFYVQLNRDPVAHSVRVVSEHSIDTHLLGLLREGLRKLQQVGVVGFREGSVLKAFDGCNIMSQHLVDYETMKIFSALPFDVSQATMLRAICQIERLQRPAKRSEKKTLNALHKQVRHKLEGPPSKVRVQQPWEKAFVLLQASIGRLELDDYTLRSESSSMADFASRMLSAAEEFGARASKNGQIAVQSLRLRRSIETSLWSSRDGVLGQFSSLSDHTVTSLKFNGITTFENVLNSTEEFLEKAADRMQPFGLNLKDAVRRVLSSSLKIEAEIQYADGVRIPRSVQCTFQSDRSVELGCASVCNETPDVIYTVIAYTDRPNGCLLYRRCISKADTITFACPPKFGKLTIHLIASMVGLDDILELEGNAEIYRGIQEPDSKVCQRRKKKVPHTTTAGETQNLTRPQRQNRVTPSPKPIHSNSARRPQHTKSSRRNTCLTEFLSPKSQCTERTYGSLSREAKQPATQTTGKPLQTKTIQTVCPNVPLQTSTKNLPSLRAKNPGMIRASVPETTQLPSEYLPQRLSQETAASRSNNLAQMPRDASHFEPRTEHVQPKNAEHIPLRYGNPREEIRELPLKTTPGVRTKTNYCSPPASLATWKQARREQQRTQKRVFAREKENPFARYQHDPNDAESFLDALSERTAPSPHSQAPSIIPLECLRAIDRANQKSFRPTGGVLPIQDVKTGKIRARSHQRRRFFSNPSVPETTILAQKAYEQDMYAARPILSPPIDQPCEDPYNRSYLAGKRNTFLNCTRPQSLLHPYDQSKEVHNVEPHLAMHAAENFASVLQERPSLCGLNPYESRFATYQDQASLANELIPTHIERSQSYPQEYQELPHQEYCDDLLRQVANITQISTNQFQDPDTRGRVYATREDLFDYEEAFSLTR